MLIRERKHAQKISGVKLLATKVIPLPVLFYEVGIQILQQKVEMWPKK